jgi:hypothetical protein
VVGEVEPVDKRKASYSLKVGFYLEQVQDSIENVEPNTVDRMCTDENAGMRGHSENSEVQKQELSSGVFLFTTKDKQVNGDLAGMVYEVESDIDITFTVDINGSSNVHLSSLAEKGEKKKVTEVCAGKRTTVGQVKQTDVKKGYSLQVGFSMEQL